MEDNMDSLEMAPYEDDNINVDEIYSEMSLENDFSEALPKDPVTPSYQNADTQTITPKPTEYSSALPPRVGSIDIVDSSTLSEGAGGVVGGALDMYSGLNNTIAESTPDTMNPYAVFSTSDAEDVDNGWGSTESPYEVMKDELTGTRKKMARPAAQATKALYGQLKERGKEKSLTLQETGGRGLGVLAKAKEFVGKEYNPGKPEQCANFVRGMCQAAGIDVGATDNPVDAEQTKGMHQGATYANSFFGEDVGTLIYDQEDLLPGDIVGFTNTYNKPDGTSFEPGTITHVGIYAGNGKVIDRPTAARPVSERSVKDFGGVAVGVRPFGAGKAGSQLSAHTISIKNPDKESIELAMQNGFMPDPNRPGVFTHGDAQNIAIGGEVNKKPIPIEDPSEWNEDKEEALFVSEEVGVDSDVWMNLIDAESNWDSSANSGVGAFGLTQLMPATAKEQARELGLDVTVEDIRKDPKLQLKIGGEYLKKQLQTFGNYPQAVAAYNAGPGRIQAVIEGTANIPQETIDYTAKVLKVSPGEAKKMISNFGPDSENLAILSESDPEGAYAGDPMMDYLDNSENPWVNDTVKTDAGPEGPDFSVPDISAPASAASSMFSQTSLYTPKTNAEAAALRKSMEYNSDPSLAPTSPELKNQALENKRKASYGFLDQVFGSDEGKVEAVKSFAASNLGMAIGVFDSFNTLGEIVSDPDNKGREGNFFTMVGDGAISTLDYVFGLSKKTKSDLKFGRTRTSTATKNLANTLLLGGLGYIKTDGNVLTAEERKQQSNIRELYKSQGGVWMSERAKEGTWENSFIELQASMSENPLAVAAVAVQMQALGAIGGSKALGALANRTGAIGALSRGTRAFLNAVGTSNEVSGSAALLSMPFLKAEMSMGVLGGVETFNETFARLSARDDVSAAEAWTAASWAGAQASVMGVALGGLMKGAGGMTAITGKNLGTIKNEVASTPLAQSLMDSKIGQGVSGTAEWARKGMAKVGDTTLIKVARTQLGAADKNVREAWETLAEKFHIKRMQDMKEDVVRASYERQGIADQKAARKYQGMAFEKEDSIAHAKADIKKVEDGANHYVEMWRDFDGDPRAASAYSRYDALKHEEQVLSNFLKEDAPRALEAAKASNNKVEVSTVSKNIKEKADALQKNKDAQTKIEEDVGAIGYEFTSHTGRPLSFKRFYDEGKNAAARLENHPSKPIIESEPRLRKLQEMYTTIAREYQERGAIAAEIAEGRKPVPNNTELEVWKPIEEPLSKDNFKNYLQNVMDNPDHILPQSKMMEIETLVNELAPSVQTAEREAMTLAGYDRLLSKMSPEDKAYYGPVYENIKKTLEHSRKQGDSLFSAMEQLQGTAGEQVLQGMIARGGGNQVDEIFTDGSIAQVMQKSKLARDFLVSKMGMNQDLIKSPNDKIFAQMAADGTLNKIDPEVADLASSLAVYDSKNILGDKIALQAGEVDQWKQKIQDGINTLGTVENSKGFMKSTVSQMIGSARAMKEIGNQASIFVGRKVDDSLEKIYSSLDDSNQTLTATKLREFGDKEKAREYVADLLFEGGGALTSAIKDIPELGNSLQPIIQLSKLLEKYKLSSQDVKFHSDNYYIKDYLPRLKWTSKNTNIDGAKILRDAGVLSDSNKLQLPLGTLDDMAETAKGRIGDMGFDKFMELSTTQKKELLDRNRRGGEVSVGNPDAITDGDLDETLVGLFLGERIKDPGSLIRSRIESIGKADTQRKFLDRLAMATHPDGTPLVNIAGSGLINHVDALPKDYIPLGDSRLNGIDTMKYDLFGKSRAAKDVSMSPEAFKLYKDFAQDYNVFEDKAGFQTAVRTLNSLVLQGSHMPFLLTIAGNVWQTMGFNFARTARAFNVKSQFSSESEYLHARQRAAYANLESQSSERNAMMQVKEIRRSMPELMQEMSKDVMKSNSLREAVTRLRESTLAPVRSADGVLNKVGVAVKGVADATIKTDEWLMDHLLFENIKEAQFGAWMYKSQEIEASLTPKMMSQGYSPTEIRDLADRMAADFVNTNTGTQSKGLMSGGAAAAYRYFGLTPQFTAARVRALQGAVTEAAFEHLPKESRKMMKEEYRYMIGKMALVGLASANMMQFALTGTSTMDNPEGKQMSIRTGKGNRYISNPLATMINTMSKLTGAQEMLRWTGIASRRLAGMEVPPDSIEGNPIANSMEQAKKQAGNLVSPAFKGLASMADDQFNNVNPAFSGKQMTKKALAGASGSYALFSNIDQYTGEKKEAWTGAAGAMGVYVSKDDQGKRYARDLSFAKKEVTQSLVSRVESALKSAKNAANETEKRQFLILAQQIGMQEGQEVSPEMARKFAGHAAFVGNKMFLTEEQMSNAVRRVYNPESYQYTSSPKVHRPAVGEGLVNRGVNQQKARDAAENSPLGPIRSTIEGM